jgi:CheY-like chemotaxis protein
MPKILVIDDDDAWRQSVVAALQAKGFETLEAASAPAGLAQARTHLPDLILCDYRMEEMDGYEALAALRTDPATAAIPFVLMTGLPGEAPQRETMTRGADDYLVKPFSFGELLKALEVRLQKQQTFARRAAQRLDDLRRNLSASLPHEFRTPLNAILGFADILRSELADLSPQEIQEMVAAIHTSAQRLDHLVTN